jgi:hypothetical protein
VGETWVPPRERAEGERRSYRYLERGVVLVDIGCFEDVAPHPLQERVAVPADRVPLEVEGVVAVVVVVGVRGMCPAGGDAHGIERPGGDDDAAGPQLELRDDLLDRHDRALRCEHGFLLHAGDAPHLHVPRLIRLLRVDDADVGTERLHRRQLLTGKGAGDARDRGRLLGQLRPGVTPEHPERDVCRPRGIAGSHARVRVLVELQRRRPAGLDCVSEPVERANAGVAAPGEDERVGTAHPDHLVIDDVRRHAHEGQLAPALPNQLVTRGMRDEVREALERHDVTVVDQLAHGLGQRQALSHQKRTWAIRRGTDASRSAP